MLRSIRGGIAWNILFYAAFCFLCRNFKSKVGEDFQEMRCESTFTTDAYHNWKHAIEMNRDVSKHAAFKVHLACYSTWKENTKRPEMGKKITSLVITEAIQRNRYYFSTMIDILIFWPLINLHSEKKSTHLKAKTKGEMDSF